MSTFKYKPLPEGGDCPRVAEEDEERYPVVHLDVGPSQVKALEVGMDVEIVIRGKLTSIRTDSNDDWGTGASLGISLRSCAIKDSAEQSAVDEMFSED